MADGAASRVQRLIESARQGRGDMRPALLRVIVDAYVTSVPPDREDLRRFTELALRLIEKSETETLTAVSQLLSTCPYAPEPIMKRLAEGEHDYAFIVLQFSRNLSDETLLEILAQGDEAKAMAIALRSRLSRSVRMALDGASYEEPQPSMPVRTEQHLPQNPLPSETKPKIAEPQAVKVQRIAPPVIAATVGASFFPLAKLGRIIRVIDGEIQPARMLLSRRIALSLPVNGLPPVDAGDYLDEVSAQTKVKLAPSAVSEGQAVDGDREKAEPASMPMLRPSVAELIDRATLQRRPRAMAGVLAHALQLPPAFTNMLMQDDSAETAVMMVKAAGLNEGALSKVLLTCYPSLAGSASSLYRLTQLFNAIDEPTAAAIAAQWRERSTPIEKPEAKPQTATEAPLLSAREAASHGERQVDQPKRVIFTPMKRA